MLLSNRSSPNYLQYSSLIIPVVIFSIIVLLYRNYIPMWDSGWYINACILPAINSPFSLMAYNCANHGSIFFGLLYSILQYIDFGNIFFIHLTSLIFLISAFCFLYSILNQLFQNHISIAIGMAVICFNPAIVANALNPTPDLAVLGLSIMCLWGFLSHRLGYAAFFGLLMLFSKESSLAFYGLATFIYFIVFYPRETPRLKFIIKKSVILIWPFIIFVYFLWYKTQISHQDLFFQNMSFFAIASNLLHPFEVSAIIRIFVLNFQWLITLVILSGYVLKYKAMPREIMFISLLFIGLSYIYSCIPHFANVRYYLTLFPLSGILFIYALTLFKQARGAVIGISVALLLFVSCFRTIDFLSSSIYGTFQFGRHALLNIPRLSSECCGYGRDQLVYNLEHTQYQKLLNQFSAYVQLKENDVLITEPLANYYIFNKVDNHTYHSTLKNDHSHTPIIIDETIKLFLISQNKMINRIFLPLFSNFPNNQFKIKVLNQFTPLSIITFNNMGYTLDFILLKEKSQSFESTASKKNYIKTDLYIKKNLSFLYE